MPNFPSRPDFLSFIVKIKPKNQRVKDPTSLATYGRRMDAGEYPNNVFYSGIDFKLLGNGGTNCANFLSNWRRVLETIFAVAFSCLLIYLGYQRLTVPQKITIIRKDRGGKRLLLVVLCLVFGVEIGFKFANRSLIFLLNPCHVTTIFQVMKI